MKNAYESYREKLDKIFEKYPKKNAMVYLLENGCRLTLTYAQFKKAIFQLKEVLNSVSLSPFDRAAVLSPLTPFTVLVNAALSYLGYTAVALDSSLPAEEINRLVKDMDVSAIFISDQLHPILSPELIENVPVFEINRDFTCHLHSMPKIRQTAKVRGDSDVAVIICSSGTTGSMKGVEVTYAAIMYSFYYLVQYTNLTANATYLNVLPVNHIVGYSIVTSCFLIGCEVGFLANPTPLGFSQGLLAYNPTNFIMIPKIFEVIQEKIEAAIREKSLIAQWYAYSAMYVCGVVRKWTGIKLRFLTKPIWSAALGRNMKICGCGAAPCMPKTVEFFLNLGIDFVDVYGATETCFPITAANCNEKYPLAGSGNVAQFPEIHIQIFNPDCQGVGEIFVKTPMIMKGYFNDPELTSASFDKNGYFKTGDYGYIDAKGNLHIMGRIKESILLQTGKKVSPSDIDAYYGKCCDQIRIASCGVPGADGFDTVHLFIETHGQSGERIAEARRRIQEQSAAAGSVYRIAAIHEIDRIPLTAVGKVKRFLLTEEAGRTPAECPEAPRGGGDLFDAVCGLILSVTKTAKPITPASRLQDDLGMDSLGVYELCTALERELGVSAAPALHDGVTVGELAALAERGTPEPREEPALSDVYPRPKTERDMRTYRRFMAVSRALWRMEAVGLENIRPGETYIFCPNHESYLDGLWVVGCLDAGVRRDMCALAAHELFEHRVFQWGLRALGGIPVQRGGYTVPAVKRAWACLASGRRHLLVHPEGTRSRSGQLGEFKPGAAKLSIKTGVKIIPVCISGAYEIFPPHRKLPRLFDWRHFRRYPLQICFGTPISPAGKTAEEITEEIRTQILSRKIRQNRKTHQ